MASKQHIIALIWDFDKTLIPQYSEKPLFDYYKVDEKQFWEEVNSLPAHYKSQGVKNISKDTPYLNHILTYVENGILKGLHNKSLRKLGEKIQFYKGLPEFFTKIQNLVQTNPLYQKYDIVLEHYIVSTGIREMIEGSKIGPLVDGIWANEFIENPLLHVNSKKNHQAEIKQIGYMIDNTSKTRAIYEINKGVNKIPGIDVNTTIPHDSRRVPMHNMVYIADGPSDIPSFSAINQNGGISYAVFKPGSSAEFERAYELYKQGRVKFFGEANYEDGSHTYLALAHIVNEIAQRIVKENQQPEAVLTNHPLPDHILD